MPINADMTYPRNKQKKMTLLIIHSFRNHLLIASFLLGLVLTIACGGKPGKVQAGDIVFQNCNSVPATALGDASGCKYDNMGLVYEHQGRLEVYEVKRTVHMVPLEDWIANGNGEKYEVRRLTDADDVLTSATLKKMYLIGLEYLGKPCDVAFEWSDTHLYSSELVWKIYKKTTGLEIGVREHLRDFDLSGRMVKPGIEKRFGNKPPLDEWVISPDAIYDSPLLVPVRQ